MTYLSKAQLREHLLNAPPGTTPGGVVAALRAQGVVMEGDPMTQPNMATADGQHSATDSFMHSDTSQLPILQRVSANASKELIGVGQGIVNHIAHPSTILPDAANAVKGMTQAAVGGLENAYTGLTGQKVPQFAPNGQFGNPNDLAIPANGTPEQQVANTLGQGIKQAVTHPIQTAINHPIATASVVAPVLGAVGRATGISDAAAGAMKQVGEASTARSALKTEASLNAAIDQGLSRGIKPAVGGKTTLSQVNNASNLGRDAVKTIVQNKGSLKLVNEFGEELPQGSLPQNLHQFSQAVDQTKKNIFSKYDALQQQAGQAGAAVNLESTASELQKVANSKTLKDLNPAVADYANRRANALKARGVYSAQEAQDAITHLNGSLETYYKNPSPQTYGNAQVDAMIANHIREGLDRTITDSVGAGYSELKKQYGALKSIEKDLNKQVVIQGRKNAKGLTDFTDIFSAGDVIAGLASHNPALIAKGTVQKVVSAFLKSRNSPDAVVKRMFHTVDSHLSQ